MCDLHGTNLYDTQPRPGWPSGGDAPPSAAPGLVTATAQGQSIASQSAFLIHNFLSKNQISLVEGGHGQSERVCLVSPTARATFTRSENVPSGACLLRTPQQGRLDQHVGSEAARERTVVSYSWS